MTCSFLTMIDGSICYVPVVAAAVCTGGGFDGNYDVNEVNDDMFS